MKGTVCNICGNLVPFGVVLWLRRVDGDAMNICADCHERGA